ncbi:MAG TPA: methyltransferase domain-containing protein [Thermoplasmata archaeon]|nr:methyltransferase domain-containing protein [Thermoplasmata archaeon]
MNERPATSEVLSLSTQGGSVPLGYLREASTVFLVARERSAQWPIEVLRTGRARLLLEDGWRDGVVELIGSPADRTAILERFRAKYGEEKFRRWYDRPARLLRIQLLDGGDLGEDPTRYRRWLEAEFDAVAADYDHHITGNRMNRLLRDRSLARLRTLFPPGARVIEVGCGSGMETLPLLRSGREIVAVDISKEMLDVVRTKAIAEGLTERLETHHVRARELPALAKELGAESLDGGYSTYGALNCEPDLRPIADGFRTLLRPGAPLLLGVYNRWCLFELVGYTLGLQWSRALGRRTNPVPVGASRFCIDIYAYSVADVRSVFASGFDVHALEGVPVLLPPSDLTVYAEKFSRRFDRLAGWDRAVGRRWPFQGLGDHFLMELRRAPGGN